MRGHCTRRAPNREARKGHYWYEYTGKMGGRGHRCVWCHQIHMDMVVS